MSSEQCQGRFAFLASLSAAPASILSHEAQTGQASSKVNYGHSLHGGISLAVIAHSIPLPCASRFLSQIYAALIHEGAMHHSTCENGKCGGWLGKERCKSRPLCASMCSHLSTGGNQGLNLGVAFKEDGVKKKKEKKGTC